MAVLSEWEIWACANEAIRQRGPEAPAWAAMLADNLLDRGNADGAAAFRLIAKRIDDLLKAHEGKLH